MRHFVFSTFLFLTAFGYGVIYSQTPTENLSGAYQWCPFHCEIIKLNANYTFDYLVDGDLFNNERRKGKWNLIGKDKIYLKTYDKSSLITKSIETGTESKENISVRVLDMASGRFAGIQITTISNGKEINFTTDENGECQIPFNKTIKISFLRQEAVYHLQNPNTNEITFELSPDNTAFLEGTFIIERDRICKIVDSEKSENCHKKIKKSIEKRLFPAEKNSKTRN